MLLLLPGGGGLAIGESFGFEIGELIRGELSFSVQDCIRAMQATTTLTDLRIEFSNYAPRPGEQPHDVQGFLQFLLQYIRNRNHLRKLFLRHACRGGLQNLVGQCVTAAAASETIHDLCLFNVKGLSFQCFVKFCRANRNGKVIELYHVQFNGFHDPGALDLKQIDALEDAFPVLEKLILGRVDLLNREASLAFTNLLSRLEISDLLVLGELQGDEDVETRVISSLLMNSPVKRLELLSSCKLISCRTALALGKDTLEGFSIHLGLSRHRGEKIDLLESSILNMPKLKSLIVRFGAQASLGPDVKKRIFSAVDACATLTEIQVEDFGNNFFTPHELQVLQGGRIERNRCLQQFMANPGNSPVRDFLKLMPQFHNCPTGSFLLVRNLPKEFLVSTMQR